MRDIVFKEEHLTSVPFVVQRIKEKHEIIISKNTAHIILKNHLKLVWKKISPAEPYLNSIRNKFLRQDWA